MGGPVASNLPLHPIRYLARIRARAGVRQEFPEKGFLARDAVLAECFADQLAT